MAELGVRMPDCMACLSREAAVDPGGCFCGRHVETSFTVASTIVTWSKRFGRYRSISIRGPEASSAYRGQE